MMMNIILTVKLEDGGIFRMGHSQADKDESHDRIVRAAAARFRKTGVEGIGVADLMKDAGLTHGGFSRRFASPHEVVAEAVERARRAGGRTFEAVVNSRRPPTVLLVALVDGDS